MSCKRKEQKGWTRASGLLALAFLAGVPYALAGQGSDDYTQGLSAAKEGAWPLARQAFLSAARAGKGDKADGTWTPGLAAAYSAYRWALETPGASDRNRLLESVVSEVSDLHKKGLHSAESYFLLSQSFTLLRREDLFEAMTSQWKKQPRFSAEADQRIITPEDQSVIASLRGDLLALAPKEAPKEPSVVRPSATPQPRQLPQNPPATPAPTDWEAAYGRALEQSSAGDWPRARQSFLEAARLRRGDVEEPTRIPGGAEPRVWRSGSPYSPSFGAAYSAYRWALEVTDDAERNRILGAAVTEIDNLLKAGQHSPEAYFVAGQALVLLRDDEKFKALNERWKKQREFNFKIDPDILTPEDKEVAELQRQELVALAQAPAEPKPAEPKPAEPKPAEPKPAEPKPAEPKPAEPKPAEPKPAEPKPAEPKPAEPKPAEPKPTEPKPTEPKPTEPKPAEPKPTEPKPDEPKPAEPKPEEARPARPTRQAPAAADSGTGRRSGDSRGPERPGQGTAVPAQGTAPFVREIKATDLVEGQAAPTGVVPHAPNKFALIIANSQSAMEEAQVPFALANAALLQESLTTSAGYSPENVSSVTNATAAQIRGAVEALAARVPEGATIFLYFAGAGANIGGLDYLAGVEATDPFQAGSMVRKDEVLRSFGAKSARVFAFFEVARPFQSGRVFGSEVPASGSVAQMMGTLEGRGLSSVFNNGQEVGIFALGIKTVLDQFRSSSIPLTEFAWQVFYAMRGGRGALGAIQTPSLPVVVLLEQDARF